MSVAITILHKMIILDFNKINYFRKLNIKKAIDSIKMIRYITTLFLGFYFLAGSMILPLGDFSLMSDLPDMYHSYCKITAEKPDIIDFIGDYIWGGKDLLGHNKHDATSSSSLQFQHQASHSLYFNHYFTLLPHKLDVLITKYNLSSIAFQILDFHCETLRPPII